MSCKQKRKSHVKHGEIKAEKVILAHEDCKTGGKRAREAEEHLAEAMLHFLPKSSLSFSLILINTKIAFGLYYKLYYKKIYLCFHSSKVFPKNYSEHEAREAREHVRHEAYKSLERVMHKAGRAHNLADSISVSVHICC